MQACTAVCGSKPPSESLTQPFRSGCVGRSSTHWVTRRENLDGSLWKYVLHISGPDMLPIGSVSNGPHSANLPLERQYQSQHPRFEWSCLRIQR